MSSIQIVNDLPLPEDVIRTQAPPPPVTCGETLPFFILPDLLRDWPYERTAINPHYHEADAESLAWLESFKDFSPSVQKAFVNNKSGLISAMTLPMASLYDLRSSCDVMHTLFMIDDDTFTRDMENTKIRCEAVVDAIVNPDKPRPENEPIVGEMARQFWKRASAHAPLSTKERFVKGWSFFVDSIIVQTSRRDRSRYICGIEEYMTARRDNIGTDACYPFLEMALQVDIPHHIMEHPTMHALQRDATDMVLLGNDMYSYRKEFLADDADYNIITVVMHDKDTDLAGSMQWVSDTHDKLVEHFLMLRKDVFDKINFPSYGEKLDSQVEAYIDGLGQWIRGHDDWNFVSGRYFGDQGFEIQQSREVIIA